MKKTDAVAIIGGEMRTLPEWAEIAGIKYSVIRSRFFDGVCGEELLEPDDDRLITLKDLRQLWGRWVYNPNAKPKVRIKKKYRGDYRWVYVGRKS